MAANPSDATGAPALDFPAVHPAPNIQTAPDVYELENRALDPEGKIEAAMAAVTPWHDPSSSTSSPAPASTSPASTRRQPT